MRLTMMGAAEEKLKSIIKHTSSLPMVLKVTGA